MRRVLRLKNESGGAIYHTPMRSYSGDLLFDWPCDIAVHITYLVSHSSSLSYLWVIKEYFRLGVK